MQECSETSPPVLSLTGNQRLLDPSSAALLNVSLPPEANATFTALWATAATARANGTHPKRHAIEGWWGLLSNASVHLAPLTAASCESRSLDWCIGTDVHTDDCVCVSNP